MKSEPEAPPPPVDGSLAGSLGQTFAARGLNVVLLSLLALACAYLLVPGLYSQRIPYGDEAAGKFSAMVIKAGRDYDIPDEETTKRKRDESRDAVLSVYDFDITVEDAAVKRVQSAFALMREAVHDYDLKHPRESLEPRVDDKKHPPVKGAKKDEKDLAREQRAADLKEAFEARRGELERRLEARIDDESFAALAGAEFGEEVQKLVEKVLARALGNDRLVAEYKDQLLSSTRGVAVRMKNGGQVLREYNERDVSHIPDPDGVRKEIEQWENDLPDELPVALRRAVLHVAARETRANLRFNRDETEARKQAAIDTVKPVVIQLKKGERIIGDGERIERRHLVIFNAIRAQSDPGDTLAVRFGGGLFALILVIAVYGFARASLRRFRPTRKDAIFGALLLVTMLALVNLSMTVSDALHDRFPTLPAETFYYAIPFAAGAMLIRFVLAAEPAVVFTLVFAGLTGVLFGNSLQFALYALVGSLVASWKVARANDRQTLFKAGVYAGLANAALSACFALLMSRAGFTGAAASALAAFLGGALLVPMMVMTLTPLIEQALGYTTDIKLLELANLNHPALKELIVQAPGTYHHSIIMGSLVEAAAEAIGANPLLARVCAYYHDIGKGKNPLYFGENQKGENRHDKLAPQMSALIIKRHVTEGIEAAKSYKLPKQVADAIPQHHGTRLVGYFFHKAMKEQEGKESPQPIDETLYRYPGPKPQFREAALVMIADAVEASSRAMQDPTPQKLQALVQKIINGIFADGQLDECDLTLRDLNEIARVFYRTLGGIYHTRPDYPAAAMQGPRQLAEVKDGKVPEAARPVSLPTDAEPKKAQNER